MSNSNSLLRCRVCGSDATHRSFKGREMMFGLKDEFDYFECSNCGSLQIYSQPIELGRFYSGSYYSFSKDKPWVAFLKRAWARFSFGKPSLLGNLIARKVGVHQGIRAVARFNVLPSAKILDVGCGTGELIQLLASLGYLHLTGVDPFLSKDIEGPGFKLLRRHLNEVEGSYDLIMFNHSLEHTFDPSIVLAEASAILANNGIMIIRIPIAGNFAWREYGADWVGLDAPRHLCIPSRKGLIQMATKRHLHLRQIYYESDEFMFWASEQYREGIPLHSPQSYTANIIKRMLPNRKMREFRDRAHQLNGSEDSDTVCALFQKAPLC